MKKVFGLILLLGVLVSCNEKVPENMAVVEADMDYMNDALIFLDELDIKRVNMIDSTVAKNGKFRFEIPLKEASIYLMRAGRDNYIGMILHPGDFVEIKGRSLYRPDYYSFENSPQSEMIRKFEMRFQQNEDFVDSLALELQKMENKELLMQKREATQPLFDSVIDDQSEYAKKLVGEKPGTLSALFIINQRFGRINLFHPTEDADYFRMVDTALIKRYPQNKHAKDHRIRVGQLENQLKRNKEAAIRLAIGKEAPEVSLPDTSGKQIPLKSLRGNYTIVYFWAAMDALSRKANSDMMKIYRKYKRYDLEVYAISLDKNDFMWKAAVKVDNLDWVNVADIGGVNTKTARLFNIPGLHYYFLLNPEGRIMYKGADLKKIDEMLMEKFLK